jgi:hypothetical protein
MKRKASHSSLPTITSIRLNNSVDTRGLSIPTSQPTFLFEYPPIFPLTVFLHFPGFCIDGCRSKVSSSSIVEADLLGASDCCLEGRWSAVRLVFEEPANTNAFLPTGTGSTSWSDHRSGSSTSILTASLAMARAVLGVGMTAGPTV